MRTRVGLFVAVMFLLGSGVARAAGDDAAREQAKKHFAEGELRYQQGDFRGAITQFISADALVPSPLLSYNIALCHEKLGENEQAARLYTRYLEQKPDAPNREDVERRIAKLRAAAPPPEPPKDDRALDDKPAEAAPPERRAYDGILARRIPDRAAGAPIAAAPAAPPEEIAPERRAPEPYPAQPAPAPQAPAPQPEAKPAYKQWWFWVIVGVSAIIVIDIAVSSSGSSEASTGAVLLRF